MKELVDTLIQRKLTLSSCESFTGGLFASTITSIPGVSQAYKGSIIAYSNEVKMNVLKIDEQIFTDCGVVSDKMALEMANKTNHLLNSEICVSFTGNAGPNASEGKEVGLWYLAVVYKNLSFVYEFKDNGTRDFIRSNAVIKAEGIILDIIRNN